MRVSKSPSEALALTNCVTVNPRDFDPSTKYILVEETYAFTIKPVDSFPINELGTSLFHRRFAQLSLNQEVRVRPFDPARESPNCYLGTMNLQLSFLRPRQNQETEVFDTTELTNVFLTSFSGQVFTVGQNCLFDFHGINLLAEIVSMETVDMDGIGTQGQGAPGNATSRGILLSQTFLNFSKSSDAPIRLKGARSGPANVIVQPNFRFEDMGIGGLDNEFSGIFRRAFASRIFPPSIVEKLGIQHVKGILLYGPPGTGKTLMARQIGKMLNAREPIIVNGPEILNKYVGQSEENVRKLFAAAEAEYKSKGDESGLHIIIFDELDAICKQRGGKNDGTGVGDSVVNQLLSKMDGVEQLNNILIIGMTNRLDMIDEALLRPGRLEIHMEISLPDEKGRVQILNVHTANMKKNGMLDHDVDLSELAALTKNFSGAEIAGLIKSASSFAFNRHVKVGTLASVDDTYDHMKVNRDDFLHALDEVHPAYGVSETEIKSCFANGVINYAPAIERILKDGSLYIQQVRHSDRTRLVSVLLHGPSNSGKTALAATIAMASDYPFIKLISPETMIGMTETAKITHIHRVFNDAYKSPTSVIIIDSIERILDWVAIGPRFSNSVLQALLVLLKKTPPKDKRLLVLGTTSQRNVLSQMEVTDAFNADLYVPNITDLASVAMVLTKLELFTPEEQQRALMLFQQSGMDRRLSIGIKKLLMIIEMARQDMDRVDKFVSSLTELGTLDTAM
ncbi:hypothetical protein CXG81DRAFT_9017 [Caulochytrium protostelioides]|uniref:Vesicular-fusion protein SEC18 n=1 Tax=Caulochytrium protostelioides TaxID=1555241 RepID=A0A4P9XE80_9FUNG|nr:hypothetical protein CXG81DRAFT_9017 [Caulochytrium protostelioides]|eukprot:RKP03847.1 hypothetical protein CXG81DRAFT_9017 [Caulochytrium protostelioides]